MIEMEITIDTLISLAGLLLGGGGGAFFTWRYMRRKAKAEAVTAEVDAAKDMQDLYQQMLADTKTEREDRKQQIDELREDRDRYKQERNEIRDKMEKLTSSFMDWRIEADNDRSKMKMDIARLGRKVDTMTPFMCGDLGCRLRQRVVLSETGIIEKPQNTVIPNQKDIKPYDDRPDA